MDELRDLTLAETNILLTHSNQREETSTILIEIKRSDERLALKGGESSITIISQ